MKKLPLLFIACTLYINSNAQESTPSKPYYFSSCSELIFSFGNVESKPLEPSNIVRFSCFLHLAEQFHYNFNQSLGFYTGLSLRNVGLINDLNDTIKVKQRVYTLGLPLALKFGNMEKETYGTVGVEGELALNYKQKVFVNDEKTKSNIWFSNRTNLFLPSVFAEVKFKNGFYLKFKYYLTDFLTEDKQKINVSGVEYNPTESQMMYVGLGFVIRDKNLNKKSNSSNMNNL